MKYEGLLLALLVIASTTIPATAQGLDFETALDPIVGLIKGTINIGWTLTGMLVGMDETSIAFFTHQLGFRDDEVNLTALTAEDTYTNCSISSYEFDDNDVLTCTNAADNTKVTVKALDGTTDLTLSEVGDFNDDGSESLDDVFGYMIRTENSEVHVSDGAKGQVMLFALILPLGMMWFLIMDFLTSTGILRRATSMIVSLGISLIAARSGVYTGLLSMISSIFGAGGFFLSMLSIYLILAIMLWFYGGIRRSKAIAEQEDIVADAVVTGFASDLTRGMMQKDIAKARAEKKQ